MSESWVVVDGEWFESGRIIHRIDPYDSDNYFYGVSHRKWGPQRASRLYEQLKRVTREPKFDDAPIGYKVKPITIGERTFYV